MKKMWIAKTKEVILSKLYLETHSILQLFVFQFDTVQTLNLHIYCVFYYSILKTLNEVLTWLSILSKKKENYLFELTHSLERLIVKILNQATNSEVQKRIWSKNSLLFLRA